MKPNSEKRDYGRVFLIVVVFLAVVLMTIFSLVTLLDNDKTSNNDTNDDGFIDLPKEDREIIFIEDSKNIVIDDTKINILEPWRITEGQRTSQSESFECITSTDNTKCTVYTISDSENEFFLSFNGAYLYKGGAISELSKIKTQFLGQEYDLIIEAYQIIDIKDSSKQIENNVFRQIYICNDSNICLTSGILSIDSEANKKQVDAFNNLISAIKFI